MDSLFPGRRTTVAIHSERPKAAGKPCLIVISGPGLGERRELGEEDTDIGRSEACKLCINSDQVSRRHANVLRIAGQYVVTDLGSTNGTFVNGKRLNADHVITTDDEIQFGRQGPKVRVSVIRTQRTGPGQTLPPRDPGPPQPGAAAPRIERSVRRTPPAWR